MAFKESFINLIKFSLRKGVFRFFKELKPPFSLFLIALYCSFQLRLSSMLIPGYFVLSALLITSLLRTRSGKSLPILFSCRLLPITIYSLLLALKPSLSILIQSDTFSSSFFKSVRSSFRFSYSIFTHVSSAYIFGIVLFRQFLKSLLYCMNSKGPKHESCGIPHSMLLLLEVDPSK